MSTIKLMAQACMEARVNRVMYSASELWHPCMHTQDYSTMNRPPMQQPSQGMSQRLKCELVYSLSHCFNCDGCRGESMMELLSVAQTRGRRWWHVRSWGEEGGEVGGDNGHKRRRMDQGWEENEEPETQELGLEVRDITWGINPPSLLIEAPPPYSRSG